MSILSFGNPEKNLIFIAVLSFITLILWLWDSGTIKRVYKRHRN